MKDPNPSSDSAIDQSLYAGAGRFVESILERYQHYKNNIPE
jgi:hypothetical protein